MELIISKLLPLTIIIVLGVLLQNVREFTPNVVNGLKFLILKISLPAILFFAFSKANLQLEYSLLFVMIFMYCIALYYSGKLLQKKLKYNYTAEYFTGFEFGMIGVALFTSIWGVEKLPVIALIALGHEVFIWFVYFPILESKTRQAVSFIHSLTGFLKSPIIIAILLGIIVNLTNTYSVISANVLGGGIFQTLELLSRLTVPLILLVVGFSLKLSEAQWAESLKMIVYRLVVVLILGGFVYKLIDYSIGFIDEIFFKAFFAFILLPPPFILPLFMDKKSNEVQFISNTLIIYTFFSFAGFVVLMML